MPQSEKEIITNMAINVFNTQIKGIETLHGLLDDNYITIIKTLQQCQEKQQGRIIVTGMGKSGHIGKKIAATFASTGSPAFYVHPAEASHGDLGMIGNKDVIICLSNSGETKELSDILNYGQRFKITTIAITSDANSTLAKQTNLQLILPSAKEACDLVRAPTTSTTMCLALGDALAMSLMRIKGFGAQDFKNFHPGGKLGASLKKVTQIMHKDIPLCQDNKSAYELIEIMNVTGFGCVGVIDTTQKLIGIVTDGDLRRHAKIISANPLVTKIMSKNPKILEQDTLSGEALNYLFTNKITALFVVDTSHKPIGIIHVHDFISQGVF